MAVAVVASQPALHSPPFDTMPDGTFGDNVEPSENDEGAFSPRKGSSPSSDDSMSSATSPVEASKASPILAIRQKKTLAAKLEDFELIRVLGRGCAGRVLLVRHATTRTVHAMKAISKRSVFTHGELHHTLAELNILRRFAIEEPDNPFISRLHYAFTDRENFYLVLEFYPGGDLATQLEIHGTLGHMRTRFYVVDIVQGLQDLHRQGIIMRDLKPENILLDARGHAVLADFGLAMDFGYRGDPKPIAVAQYAGEKALPPWAGAGLGSERRMKDGKTRIIVDRAYSFVGTSDYLAPEVITGKGYSYAADWWPLGCMMVECMVGRVPFRKRDDEPVSVLWDKILNDPWYHIFDDPKLGGLNPTEWGMCDGMIDLVDLFLQKDPERRITEPHIQGHEYFAGIDWEVVRRGDYTDPYGLQLHSALEDNTQYFPKLCLEEVPSVDMSNFDNRSVPPSQRTPLNDNLAYMKECAKFKRELESFAWSRDDEEVDSDAAEVAVADSSLAGAIHEVQHQQEELAMRSEKLNHVESPKISLQSKDSHSALGLEDIPPPNGEPSPLWTSEPLQHPLPAIREPIADATATGAGIHETISIPSTIAEEASRADPDLPPKHLETPSSDLPPVSPVPSLRRPEPSSPVRIGTRSPQTSPTVHLGPLPQHLPSAGLSVSDMVSIPSSPGMGSPARIVLRRHPMLPPEDNAQGARLSVEMNGNISQLGDEDWEQLDADELLDVPSAPNGPVHGSHSPSLFHLARNRVLRPKPNTIKTSNLRRQAKVSDSTAESTSTRASPTKPHATYREQFPGGGAAFVEGTRKAFEKLKFPKLKKSPPPARSSGGEPVFPRGAKGSIPTSASAPRLAPVSESSSTAEGESPSRPTPLRRKTESFMNLITGNMGAGHKKVKKEKSRVSLTSKRSDTSSESLGSAVPSRRDVPSRPLSRELPEVPEAPVVIIPADRAREVGEVEAIHVMPPPPAVEVAGAPQLELRDVDPLIWDGEWTERLAEMERDKTYN